VSFQNKINTFIPGFTTGFEAGLVAGLDGVPVEPELPELPVVPLDVPVVEVSEVSVTFAAGVSLAEADDVAVEAAVDDVPRLAGDSPPPEVSALRDDEQPVTPNTVTVARSEMSTTRVRSEVTYVSKSAFQRLSEFIIGRCPCGDDRLRPA